MTQSREISLSVPVLARVEGEGALDLEVHGGRIQTLLLRIFEPPRLFEKFLEGREYQEVPDMVARICGICPVAYQMSAVHAIEGIFGLDPGPWVRAMRRVFYCGEWIQSHSLHIHLVGHRADAADARHHIRNLLVFPAFQEFLKEPRRLEYAQAQRLDAPVMHFQVECAFPLHPRQDRHAEADLTALGHGPAPASGGPPRQRPGRCC